MIFDKNITTICLPAAWDSDIIWSVEQKLADEILSLNGRIFWEFDFGCTDSRGFRLQDSLQWNTLRLAVEHFTTSIWPKYETMTIGISLFRGALDWIHYLYWDEAQREHFQRWKEVSRLPSVSSCFVEAMSPSEHHRHILSLYATTQLSDYLHRLSSYLPEDAMHFVSFDTKNSPSIWRMAQMLSRERFPYILIDVPYPPISSQRILLKDSVVSKPLHTALCLPQDEYFTIEIGEIWESIYIELEKNAISFRIIPETFIAQEWTDLEVIVVLTKSLSEFGLRQLQGFSISGGRIIFYGGTLELQNAIMWEDWIR